MARSRKELTCIDLFAGCGGLSLGLEQAGFRPLAFCELSAHAAESYRANRESLDVRPFADVKEMNHEVLIGLKSEWKAEGIKQVDLVCGGPPCQGYSGIGHRRSYHVEREQVPSNHLYKEMIRVIETVKPRAFLFENVRGLISGRWTADGKPGDIWRDVRGAFDSIEGYDVRHAVVQAKDYGVPQNRPRVLIVGIQHSEGWRPQAGRVADGLLPEPRSGEYPHLKALLHDLLDAHYLEKDETNAYLCDPKSDVQERLRRHGRRLLRKGDPLTEQFYSRHSPKIRAKFEAMHELQGEIPEEFRTKKFAQRLLRPTWDADGPNITATSLPDDFVHYKQPRTLTVREWARLQTFPDWYRFRGPRTTGGTRRAGIPTDGIWDRDVPRYTQIGNAVPVWLAEAVGRHLRSILG
jgi:DNA (cytosine-5)-methyltransferase 1